PHGEKRLRGPPLPPKIRRLLRSRSRVCRFLGRMEKKQRRGGGPPAQRALSWPAIGPCRKAHVIVCALTLSLFSQGSLIPGLPPDGPTEKEETKEKPQGRVKSLLGAVPQDALLCIRARGTKGLLEKLKKSPLHGFQEKPAVQSLQKSLEAQLRGT